LSITLLSILTYLYSSSSFSLWRLSLSSLFILAYLLFLFLLPVEAEPLFSLPLERLLLFVSEMKVVLLLEKFELYFK
jgi:hypothetical protein